MQKPLSIDKTLFDGRRIALALSGGRDSMCLFNLLKAADIDFAAVHVEHGIRGERSKTDRDFVVDYAKQNGVKVEAFEVDAPQYAKKKGLSLEQAARELRYACFDGLLDSGKYDAIVLAHHASDQAETILMRILRGTGVKGLQGMSADNGKYIRPMLGFSREDIDAYVQEYAIPYVEDDTNSDEAYTRNFLRAELKRLKSRYPNLEQSFARLARNATESEQFISRFVPEVAIEDGAVKIELDDLKEPAVAKRLILKAAAKLGVYQDIEEKHFEIVCALKNAGVGKRVELTHSLVAYRESNKVVLALAQDECKRCALPFNPDFRGVLDGIEYEEVCAPHYGDGALYLDLDKVKQGALIRSREDGDEFCKYGGGSKSLGDYLTDKKVPLRLRDSLSLCADGNEVLWIAGIEVSDKVKVDGNTKRILRVSVKR